MKKIYSLEKTLTDNANIRQYVVNENGCKKRIVKLIKYKEKIKKAI